MRKYLTIYMSDLSPVKYGLRKPVSLVAQRQTFMGDTYDCPLVAVRLEHPGVSSAELRLIA